MQIIKVAEQRLLNKFERQAALLYNMGYVTLFAENSNNVFVKMDVYLFSISSHYSYGRCCICFNTRDDYDMPKI